MKVTQYVVAVLTVFLSFFPPLTFTGIVWCSSFMLAQDVCAELLVSASRALPAGPGDQMGQRLRGWGLMGAPSAPVVEPLMGSNPQTPEF